MFVTVNMLLRWKLDENPVTERVLWFSKSENKAFVINTDTQEMPYVRRWSDIMTALEEGRAEELSFDPYIRVVFDSQLTEKERLGRQKSWAAIQDIVIKEPDIYLPQERSRLVKDAAKENGVSEKSVYHYLKRYWVRGQNPNALLPDLHLCGKKGMAKNESAVKRGRPRNKKNGNGINVTEEIKQIFRVAIKKYYYTTAQHSLKMAYNLMLKDFFAESFKYVGDVKVPILKPKEELPSYKQFLYWHNKEKDIKNEVTYRISAKRYAQQYRPIIGNSTNEAIGPGSIYQFDSTVADVYLCSSMNRNWIVGRPCVYVAIDVFSRMIVGIYCGFESGSWLGAMNALANCTADKVVYCAEYGIPINKEDWDTAYLPEAILADRGEMEGKNAENLVDGLGIKIMNTPPYRADWKSIVEQNFRLTNLAAKPFLPGAVQDGTNFRERGSHDYRLDAKLDIHQFTQIMIRCVLYHNNQHHLSQYHKDLGMIQDGISMIPREIWNWGIENRAGKLRSVNEDVVKLHLMPTDEATVTARGIRFQGIFYSSSSCLKERMFEKARQKTWKIQVAYDPRNMDYIYIKNQDGTAYDKCTILEYQTAFKHRALEEIQYFFEEEKLKKDKIEHQETQGKVELISQIQDIVKKADSLHKAEAEPNESKTARLKGIRENKGIEKTEGREREGFELGKQEKETPATVVQIQNEEEPSNENNQYNFLVQLQQEAMKKIYE